MDMALVVYSRYAPESALPGAGAQDIGAMGVALRKRKDCSWSSSRRQLVPERTDHLLHRVIVDPPFSGVRHNPLGLATA